MNNFFIRKRNEAGTILQLDDQIKPIKESRIENSKNAKKLRGTYHKYNIGFFGDYSHKDHHIFFINDKKYNYSDPGWTARIEKVGDQNRFIMTQHGAVIIDFTYTPEEILTWDPYSDEEDDLLTMVCNIKNNPERLQTLLEIYKVEQSE